MKTKREIKILAGTESVKLLKLALNKAYQKEVKAGIVIMDAQLV